MARKPTRRRVRPAPKSRAGRSLFPAIERKKESLEGGVKKIIYSMKIPKELRGVTARTQKAREEAALAIARTISAKVRTRHGEGVDDYRVQHFMATFKGTMYEEDDTSSQRMGRAIFGTGADADLNEVQRQLADRILSMLEGETPRTQGPVDKYGYFASGVSEVEMIVMQREGKGPEEEDDE